MTAHNPLFSAVFLSQVLLISLLIPHWIKTKAQHIMATRSETDYPKLYPMGQRTIINRVNRFQNQHLILMVLGLAMFIHASFTQANDLLNWDNQAVLAVYFMFQQLPYLALGLFYHQYQQQMRDASPAPKRRANLQPRHLTDFVPVALLALALLMIITLVVIIFYAQQNPFPGFAGLWNILFVLMLNLFFGAGIYVTINGRRTDPHIDQDDRLMQQSIVAKLLVLSSIAASLFLAASMLMSIFELKAYENLVQMIYFQIIALLGFVTLTSTPVDFSVYANANVNPNQGAQS